MLMMILLKDDDDVNVGGRLADGQVLQSDRGCLLGGPHAALDAAARLYPGQLQVWSPGVPAQVVDLNPSRQV